MARMPAHTSKWFQSVLEDLAAQGEDSSYASTEKIPTAILSGEYDRPRPTLEFLRHLSQANKLRRGVFLPLPCASCSTSVWAFVPTSGEAYVMETRDNGTLRHHYCGVRGTSKISMVRACLPRTLSWRGVETSLRGSTTHERSIKPDETVIGFVAAQSADHLHLKTLEGNVIRVPSAVKHPVYTLVVAMPDPFRPSSFVIRAPTVEQFMHGLPGSLPAIVPEAALQATITTSPAKVAQADAKAVKAADQPVKPMTSGKRVIPKYPEAFKRREVTDFLKTVALAKLSKEQQERWMSLEAQYGWHLGGLVPLPLAQQFAALIQHADERPGNRQKYLARITKAGEQIAAIVLTEFTLTAPAEPVKQTVNAKKVMPKYPPEFDRTEVRDFLKAVTLATLPEKKQKEWLSLEAKHDWHLGGLVPLPLAQQFALLIHNANERPHGRKKYLSRLTKVGQQITAAVSRHI